MSSVIVRFDAELRLVDDEVPETLSYASVQQAVQDSLGFTGVVVIDVTEYEQQSSDARTGDRPRFVDDFWRMADPEGTRRAGREETTG